MPAYFKKGNTANPFEKKPFIEFNGVRYTKEPLQGYWRSTTKPRHRLHVAVWEYFHGPVPKGWHVHHKKHDHKDNPGPVGFTDENLELLEEDEHGKRHHYTGRW